MPGFPLAAIGAGLGKGIEAIQEQRLRAMQEQQQRMRMEQYQQEQKALQGGFGAALSGAFDTQPLKPLDTGGLDMPNPTGLGSGGGGGAPMGRPPSFSPTPTGSGFSSGLQKLTELGLSPEIAAGPIEYMRKNESADNPLAVNPTSGALGRAQWLGPRKAALTAKYGPNPSDEQQAEFMASELQGPESRTLAQLKGAKTPKEAYDIWGKSFERPGPGALTKAGVGGGGDIHPDVQQGLQDTLQTIPPQVYGRMSVQAMAQQIEKANPGADPAVKMMILERGIKLTAPSEQRMWDAYKMQHDDQFKKFELGLKTKADARAEAGNLRAEGRAQRQDDIAGMELFTDPTNQQQYRYNKITREATTLGGEPYKPGGAAKMGTGDAVPLPALPELPKTAEWEGKPNKPPPPDMLGGKEADPGIWAAAITYAKSGGSIKPPFSLWGKNPSAREFNQVLPAAQSALNMTPDQMTNLASAYAAQRAASQVVGRVSGATAQGAQELQQFRPFIEDTLSHINVTNYPTVNSIANAVRQGTGDPYIVQLNSYIQSTKNAYVQIMTRSGRPTVYANRRADELLGLNMGVEQIPAALDAMANEAAVAQSSAKRAIQEVTGQEVTAPPATPAGRSVKPGRAVPAADGPPYKVNQIIDRGGKKYRVVGGDPNDPDVEPVQ